MSLQHSCLYTGRVVHRRTSPRRHRFSYRVLSVLLDLDELGTVHRRYRLFSVNRFNLFSFFERDHTGDDGSCLKQHIEAVVCGAGIDIRGGSIALLCYPRVLGYAFNPLSVYFCHDRAGRIAALVYEVTNTFGERHRYLFRVGADDTAPLRHRCCKALYVSPFIGMDATYRFAVVPPGGKLSIAITETEAGTPVLNATFAAQRQAMSDLIFARYGFAYFAMGLKVIGAIHWEGFKLWCKGLTVHRHRPLARNDVTVVDRNR